MTTHRCNFPEWLAGLPSQQHYHVAVEKAMIALRQQAAEQIAWLGAQAVPSGWRLRVLDDTLQIDASSGLVTASRGEPVRSAWQVLTLHYLGVADRPELRAPQITFADLPSGRGYANVYHQRVIGRLCATAGRHRTTLDQRAEVLGAVSAEGGDAAFDLDVFPRLRIRLVWHAGDDEFPPTATFLLPDNVEEFFCTEDIVVLCESCVARLGGGRW